MVKYILSYAFFALLSLNAFAQHKVYVKKIEGETLHNLPDSVLKKRGQQREDFFLNPTWCSADFDSVCIECDGRKFNVSSKVRLPYPGENMNGVIIVPIVSPDIQPLSGWDKWEVIIKDGRGSGTMKRMLMSNQIPDGGKIYLLSAKAKIDLRDEKKCCIIYRIESKKKTEKRLAKWNVTVPFGNYPSDTKEPPKGVLLGNSLQGADITYNSHVFHTYRLMQISEPTNDKILVQWSVYDSSRSAAGNGTVLARSDEDGTGWRIPIHNGKAKGEMIQPLHADPSIVPEGKNLYIHAKARYNQKKLSKCMVKLKIKARRK